MFVNRHPNFRVNFLFMDLSVKKVAMMSIHSLKWSRGFNTQGPWTFAHPSFGGDREAFKAAWADHGDGWLANAPFE